MLRGTLADNCVNIDPLSQPRTLFIMVNVSLSLAVVNNEVCLDNEKKSPDSSEISKVRLSHGGIYLSYLNIG